MSEDDIRRIINKSSNKSCSLDPMPTWLLKLCCDELVPIITTIINTSISTGEFPVPYKTANLLPHLKKDNLDHEILKNFRPISNLQYVSKLLERTVDHQIERYINNNNLCEPFQSAYRPFHSTETALIKVTSDILSIIDQGNIAVLIMLDLSAAFDTIDHTKLLNRLDNDFGIRGNALKWIKSYLTSRYQCVCINNIKSNPVELAFGVPQGSVLGPKLFSLYTKPLTLLETMDFTHTSMLMIHKST